MVDEILKLAKEDYNAAVEKHTKRVVDKVLADEKASLLKTEKIEEAVLPANEMTKEDIKPLLLKEITYPQLLKILFLLTGELSYDLVKRQISKLLTEKVPLTDIGRTIYYIYEVEKMEYIPKYGIGIVSNYLVPSLEFFRKEIDKVGHYKKQGLELKNFKPKEIKVDIQANRSKRKGINLIDMSQIGAD